MDYLTMYTGFHCHVATFFSYWYYAMYQYKCNMHYVLLYEELYNYFPCNLQRRQGLIKNSAKFKISTIILSIRHYFATVPQDANHYIIYIILYKHRSPPSAGFSAPALGQRRSGDGVRAKALWQWWQLCQWFGVGATTTVFARQHYPQ